MITLQKIDFSGQCILGALMILSFPFLFFYGFGLGLLILGCWQLISALANSYCFVKKEMKNAIRNYWLFTVIDLVIFFSPPALTRFFDPDDLDVLPGIAAAGGVAIAIYYLWIYKKLIALVDFKSGISGIVKK